MRGRRRRAGHVQEPQIGPKPDEYAAREGDELVGVDRRSGDGDAVTSTSTLAWEAGQMVRRVDEDFAAAGRTEITTWGDGAHLEEIALAEAETTYRADHLSMSRSKRAVSRASQLLLGAGGLLFVLIGLGWWVAPATVAAGLGMPLVD